MLNAERIPDVGCLHAAPEHLLGLHEDDLLERQNLQQLVVLERVNLQLVRK